MLLDDALASIPGPRRCVGLKSPIKVMRHLYMYAPQIQSICVWEDWADCPGSKRLMVSILCGAAVKEVVQS